MTHPLEADVPLPDGRIIYVHGIVTVRWRAAKDDPAARAEFLAALTQMIDKNADDEARSS